MILTALDAQYQRLAAQGKVPLFGFSQEKISYALLIDAEGRLVNVHDIRDVSGKKPLPATLVVPQPEKRTAGIKSNFLWDKTGYVLGVSSKDAMRAAQEHEAFKALHQQWLAGVEDEGLQALLKFLAWWTPDRFELPEFRFSEEMCDANMVFRLDGERAYLHERAAAQQVRARMLAEGGAEQGMCLISGEQGAIARLHPAIKGVNGAQSSGASIVSFNLEAFTSYGKTQGANAPVSERAAFAYTTMLNHLLQRDTHHPQRMQVGNTTMVFWAVTPDGKVADKAVSLFSRLLDPDLSVTDTQETAKLRSVLEAVAEGRALETLDPELTPDTRFYVLGLAPNASRLSIRFWLTNTLAFFAEQIGQHYRDLLLEPLPWRLAPSVWRLVYATAPSLNGKAKAEDIPPQLEGEVMRAVLGGGRYPYSLLTNVVMRMRADGDLSGIRVALCKAVLERNRRFSGYSTEEIPVSLDKENQDPAYRLGRLFAVLEDGQRAALGDQVNATIRDRYYGAASATPAAVFPMLMRNGMHHLAKIRKEKPGLAHVIEANISEIINGLEGYFPKILPVEGQGRFAIGYYHQSQRRFAGKKQAENETSASVTEEGGE